MQHISPIPTHIISGYLGAGKTTFLTQLFQLKPEHERWAVLMNEFGQIGIDQHLLNNDQGIAVKEVVGGCLCCTSQLPMQIALGRLICEYQPDRLWIEPSGLGHPLQLLQQLSEPHWQTQLQLNTFTLVIDGHVLHDQDWVEQHLDTKLFQYAQLLIISHADLMTFDDFQTLDKLKKHYGEPYHHWVLSDHQTFTPSLSLNDFNQPCHYRPPTLRPLLTQLKQTTDSSTLSPSIKTLPYHYQEFRQGIYIAGWALPKSWVFLADDLIDLFASIDFIRLKGIFNTDQGWLYFNCNHNNLSYRIGQENIDQRLEIMNKTEQDWYSFEMVLIKNQSIKF